MLGQEGQALTDPGGPYCTSRGKGRHNLLPVMTCDGLLDWYITEGSMNSVKIRDFGKRCLVSSG